ncbi:MAG: DUF2752 domain-containing protein [Phycisphaerales bacterium]|nr:DUF2752 domain-containing protein [Phycisphaerae bacterium]NNM25964.1 DUF2752 domain-containing protein [Phycisphaerales bacterium]
MSSLPESISTPPAAPAVAVRSAADPGSTLLRRGMGAFAAVASGGVLAIAVALEPAGAGLGTHEQLRLPACGWITLMDLPCPTCGMTTSFAHAANGDLVQSFLAQPLGFALAIATAMVLLIGVHAAVTGSRLAHGLTRFWGPRSGWILAGAVLAAWGFKVFSYRVLVPEGWLP